MTNTGQFRIEEQGPIVRVHCTGLYETATIESHAIALRQLLNRRRTASLPVRVLIDLTGATVQRPEIASLLAARMQALYRPEDRVAVLCTSALHAMQVRRANSDHQLYVTASQEAATRHLMA